MNKPKQNKISQNFSENDLKKREGQVLQEASEITGFFPTKLLGRSSWWGLEHIGAFHYAGTYENKPAVLKVQGVKPATSEIYMLESFSRENRSNTIRPPYLYASIPWDNKKRYEALVMEDVKGDKIVSVPTTKEEVEKFFAIHKDYQQNCLNRPWIGKPDKTISEGIEENFKKWREASRQIYPNHPCRESSDKQLVDEAIDVLKKKYENIGLEFQHGHFSADDLYKVDDKVVLLSNLYWSWRPPLYDSIFAYHWHLYNVGNKVEGVTPEQIEEQRQLWLSTIYLLPRSQANPQFLKLALLERLTAGLVIDSLTVDPNLPIAKYLVSSTRELVKKFLNEV